MQELIERLDQWLQKNRPKYYTRLLPKLSDNKLGELEKDLGFELPIEFKTFYSWKNGQSSKYFGSLIDKFRWLNSSRVVSANEKIYKLSLVNRYEADSWWYSQLVPFLYNSGEYYCLDPQGMYSYEKGQIVLIWDKLARQKVIYTSFQDFLKTLIYEFEQELAVYVD